MLKKISLVSIVAAVSFVIVPSGALANDHDVTSDSSTTATPAKTGNDKLAEVEARAAKIKAEQARRQADKAARETKIAQEKARRDADKAARETKIAAEKAARDADKAARETKIAQEKAARETAKK